MRIKQNKSKSYKKSIIKRAQFVESHTKCGVFHAHNDVTISGGLSHGFWDENTYVLELKT